MEHPIPIPIPAPVAPYATRRATPTWWTEEHESSWSHVRDALRRDWEQTKSDLTGARAGRELNQAILDTLDQAVGSERIPPDFQPNVGNERDRNWELAEPALRYGFGARAHHAPATPWNEALEVSLQNEWAELRTIRPWRDAKEDVRRGWNAASRKL